MTVIRIKRAYEPYAKEDGARFLVERLWPRGMKKDALHMDAWYKNLAPSATLRRWFNHDPAKFQRRYRARAYRQFCRLPTSVGCSQTGPHYTPIQRSRHGT